jgi:hypothetical protein
MKRPIRSRIQLYIMAATLIAMAVYEIIERVT